MLAADGKQRPTDAATARAEMVKIPRFLNTSIMMC